MLLVNDFIQFGPPRKEIGNPYNCFRLTEKGKKYLSELKKPRRMPVD
jgi:hypothetical protein